MPGPAQFTACADECARSSDDRSDHRLVRIKLGARHRIVGDTGDDDLVWPVVEGEDEMRDPLLERRVLRRCRLGYDLGAEDLPHHRAGWLQSQGGMEVEGIANARTSVSGVERKNLRRILVDRNSRARQRSTRSLLRA